MQCQSKKRDGGRCGARAIVGKKHCAMHGEPGRAAVLGSMGGRRRALYRPESLLHLEAPKTAADVKALFAQSILEIRAGQLDPRSANAIAYLGAGFLRALEVSEIESQLITMEVQLNNAKQTISQLTKSSGGY
jgi:hypothetical protein